VHQLSIKNSFHKFQNTIKMTRHLRLQKHYLLYFFLASIVLSCSPKDKQEVPAQQIPVVEVLQMDIPLVKDFVGQTYGLFDIAVRARVDGFLEGMHFSEGTRVKKGQLLYTIDAAPFQAKVAEAMSRVAEAQTALVKAASDYNRIKPLADIQAVSQSDLDAANAALGAAEATVEAAEANLKFANIQLSYTKLRAPISGIIGRSEAKVSDYVGREPNPIVLNVVSRIDTILVRFSISELTYLEIVNYMKTKKTLSDPQREKEAELELIFADESTHEYLGKLDFVDRQVDPTTGTLQLQASFPNPQKTVRPGQFAKIRAIVDESAERLLVPQKCIQELQGKYNVFVVNDSNQVEFRQVEVGPTYGDLWIIKEGLTQGEKVVLEGVDRVRSQMTIDPQLTEFSSVNQSKEE